MAFQLDSLSLVIVGTDVNVANTAVRSFQGSERINRPYAFRIEFANSSSTKPSDWIGKSCHFAIKVGGDVNGATRQFSSVVLAAGQLTFGHRVNTFFVEFGPQLALRDLSRRSQVTAAGNATLADILQKKLGADNSGQPYERDKAAVASKFLLASSYALDGDSESGSMLVQYQETDLNYINRICEAAGIFYYFSYEGDVGPAAGHRHDVFPPPAKTEEVHFADRVASALPVLHLQYKPELPPLPDATMVMSFASRQTVVPEKFVARGVFDYGSSFDAFAPAQIASDGFGTVVEFVSSFDFQSDLNALAGVRANEIGKRSTILTGQSTAIGLSAGSRFRLDGDPSNGSTVYFVEAVTHSYSADQSVGTAGFPARYVNTFQAVPASDSYRPPRLLKKPVMPGVYYGEVQTTLLSARRAELTSTGRYHIQLRFDESPFPSDNGSSGDHSWRCRMATPYGGVSGVGQHFPLLNGTEVIVAFANGDPDRPIIIATIATKDNASPVTSANFTRNRIVSPSGVMIELDDGA
ncbi:MAG: contractile injection system protein, VgrG/Pvc8 family [Ancalomicrobiaceae bacterium]|nr:contractile injection system protein, VgrG/Pvc8 family [Ancalomicrobiaceae bacterium]